MSELYRSIQKASEGSYPLHMPGHKRRMALLPGMEGILSVDLTEIPGTDDLHDPEGILRAAMDRTAGLYGSDHCFYLVGGSTVGILAAVAAVVGDGELILARNAHKAVYHAVEMGRITPHYIQPMSIPGTDLPGSVRPEDVKAALDRWPKSRAVLVTSPTYEGVLSDIAAIARICHEAGKVLIVDEAHGAHLVYGEETGFPVGAVACGADLVIQSAHKTLPALGMSAFLHLAGDRVKPEAVRIALEHYETSSPSYPLMAGLDALTAWLMGDGKESLRLWSERAAAFREGMKALPEYHMLEATGESGSLFALDPGKLYLGWDHPGKELEKALHSHGFQVEMTESRGVLAMTSPADPEEIYEKLLIVLKTIAQGHAADPAEQAGGPGPTGLPPIPEACLSIREGLEFKAEFVPLRELAHRVAAEYLWCYPPGIPYVVPGELIREEEVKALLAVTDSGREILGRGNPLRDRTSQGPIRGPEDPVLVLKPAAPPR